MKKIQFKFVVAIAALIITLALFWGAYKLNNRLGLEKPLETRITGISGVEQVKVEKKNGYYQIDVKLNQVDNLPRKYYEISNIIDNKLKSNEYQLKIKDRRNQKLQSAYDDVQLAIYQGIASNQYLWLKEQIQKNVELKGINSTIFVDQERLYVQMRDGDKSLYEIIQRSVPDKDKDK